MCAASKFEVPELQLVGRFTCEVAPVQAEGTVASMAFYFRSRHDTWSFAVAPTPDIDAADISQGEQGFFREAKYGSERSEAASYMPFSEARAIIERCAHEFLRQPPTRQAVEADERRTRDGRVDNAIAACG